MNWPAVSGRRPGRNARIRIGSRRARRRLGLARFALLGAAWISGTASDAATRYVARTSATPAPPYTAWATAATNIQDAIDAAASHDEILVTNGVYDAGGRAVHGSMINRVAIDKPVTVRSVNGPGVTTIKGHGPRGAGAVRCAYVGADATLEGFLLTGGATRTDGDPALEQSGGGAWCEASGVLRNCMLADNAATYGGGGAYQGTLNNCVLEGNAATDGGGGAWGATLNACALSGNTAGFSGGGAWGGTLNNCTLVGNTAGYSGGGTRGGTQNNCIVYFNTAPALPNYHGGVLRYCCATPLPAGTGNLAGDPALASASHLSAASPCRGAGSAAYATGTDLDGEAWGAPPSMGCDEVRAGAATGALRVAAAANYPAIAVGGTVTFTADIEGRTTRSAWDFGDGTPAASNRPAAAHAFAAAGSYEVTLRAFNETYPGGVAATVRVEVTSAAVHYVRPAHPAPAAPYTSWETAAATIQDAIDAASPSDLVLVTNGVYDTGGRAVHGTMTNRVTIDKALAVRSVNGPDVTAIVGRGPCGDGAVRGAYVGAHATLAGFLLTHGATRTAGDSVTEQSGGGAWCEASGVLSNCTLAGNAAWRMGGGGYEGTRNACTFTGNAAGGEGGGACYGALNGCTLAGNSASNMGGGAHFASLNSCTLSSNTALYGGGAFNSALNACTLDGNAAKDSGGGVLYGTLHACTLSGNSAVNGGGAFSATLSGCTLAGNTASSSGGGAHSATLRNCALHGNAAPFGGGASSASLTNCTLAGNTAGNTGGGAYNCTLYNAIVWSNTAAAGPNYMGGALNYCCTAPLPAGSGNVTNDPALASVSHLSAASPCRGVGSAAYATGTDLDGEAWGAPPSMGCDEFRAGAATGALRVAIGADYPVAATGRVVTFTAQVDGRTTGSAWDFGDGTAAVSNAAVAGHAFAGAGAYTVILRAFNETYPGGVAATARIEVVAATVRYVRPANAAAAAPYTSWATAATNIQNAVDAAASNDLVLVTNGVYAAGGRVVYGSLTNRLAIGKPVTVRSVNGPGVTAIRGEGPAGDAAVRCVYVGTNATLAGFLLTNGSTRAAGNQVQEQSGGGAWCEASGVLTNCVLAGNAAYSLGGGACQGALKACTLSGNTAYRGGGAWGATLTRCTLTANSAHDGGGAADSTLVVCTLAVNSAKAGGGATSGGSLSACILAGNRAQGLGGGSDGSTLSACTLSGNAAADGGGAALGTLNDCTLTDNRAENRGGGAYNETLNRCTLTGNTATYGGASYASTLTACTLASNSATEHGGGAAGGTLDRCTLLANTAPLGGGVRESVLKNCALSGNMAASGGGAYFGSLRNCTLVGNMASDAGGGALHASLYNCIVYYNTAPSSPNCDDWYMAYSCTTPSAYGDGNITADPGLVDNAHLGPGSPCIGAGSSDYVSGADLDGEAWGSPPSMGCDEFHVGAATGALQVTIVAAPAEVTAGYPAAFLGQVLGHAKATAWDFGDGTPAASNRLTAEHTFAAPGSYPVTLRAFNDTCPGGVAATARVTVAAAVIHYVRRDNAAPAAPYTSWATAATNIQDAIDAAWQAGAQVVVTNGVYDAGGRAVCGRMTNRVAIDKVLTVRSVNGPGVTAIRGQGPPGTTGVRCVYVGTNATLAGFLLTNGATRAAGDVREYCGGGAWCEDSGALSNCVLAGNAAADAGGGVYGGALDDCVLAGNAVRDSGGGAFKSILRRCTVSGNSAHEGGGAYASALDHCILTSNSAAFGGGASGGTLNHCALADNTAHSGGGAAYGTLNYCTLAGNLASNSGGGALGGRMTNCIVYFNTAPASSNHGQVMEADHCCTAPLPAGTGHITNDPRFVDRAAGNLRLLATSPCIDAGTNTPDLSGAVDLDGHPRVVHGRVDMGAYEFQGVATPDADGDGIPDAWETAHGLNPAIPNPPGANADGDPCTDWQEYVADTEPTNAASYLAIVAAGLDPPPAATVRFLSSSNRLYTLLLATNLVSAAWSPVAGQGPRAGLGGLDAMADTNTAPAHKARSYRIEVQVP